MDRSYPQACAVPWRPGAKGPEVLLISTRGGLPADPDRWVLPQGGVEPGKSAVEAAADEAWEEAGVMGRIERRPFAQYEYEIGAGSCRVDVFGLEVTRVEDDWPEAGERKRRWLSQEKALDAVSGETLRGVLASFQPPGA